jgi:poly-gamma-glutamate synthesis protein (capsule biosynthesis protein)
MSGQSTPLRQFIADLNYINWETSVGNICNVFWSRPSVSTNAFLTHPEELADAVSTGFNLVGLANNHTYDCLRSPEGLGPLQTYSHVARLRQDLASLGQLALFSGVFLSAESEAPTSLMSVANGKVPVRFLSAYVGGDASHCRQMLCDNSIERYSTSMASQPGLRIMALHSWDSSSHQRLKAILRSWLSRGLIDVAIGSGPHVAESVVVIQTPRGLGILATSLGNFIHPGLSLQPNNVVLKTIWSFDAAQQKVRLDKVSTVTVSCDGSACRQGSIRNYVVPIARK